jgi:hypothetical protein
MCGSLRLYGCRSSGGHVRGCDAVLYRWLSSFWTSIMLSSSGCKLHSALGMMAACSSEKSVRIQEYMVSECR